MIRRIDGATYICVQALIMAKKILLKPRLGLINITNEKLRSRFKQWEMSTKEGTHSEPRKKTKTYKCPHPKDIKGM